MKNLLTCSIFIALLTVVSCSGDETEPTLNMTVIAATINGSSSSNTNLDIPIEASIVIVFSSALNPAAFESAFSVVSGATAADYTVAYSNATTKVTATMTLDYTTTYTVNVAATAIGLGGEKLTNPLTFSFATAADDVIRSMTPCTTVSDCLRSVELTGSQGNGTFEFYSNYPIYEENAQWEELTDAVIVVHGASHDPDNYYTFLTNTFESQSLSSSTILIAPFFRSTTTGSAEDFYWPNTDWRRGSLSSNANKLSSFEALDAVIDQLANSERFPVLKKIIVTGHSSGAAFTHVYSASNRSEANHPSIDFEYVVANSQFFYYPDGQRIDESTNQLYTPSDCAGYTIWPLGYIATPPYLSGVNPSTFNSMFVDRSVTYLLGNGNQSDPTLNTTNCENILQGSSRYKRGENMFRYMELVYPGTHHHNKVIVEGIGHDGQGMYQSASFKALLSQLLQ